ncbi:MAG: aminotransferase class V-fold PLP-dependent enzyme, partial [Actinoplanes sp.]
MEYTGVPAGAAAYLDAATAVPLHPVAKEALLASLADGWADPARLYAAGRRAQQLSDAARAAMAESLAVRPDELSLWPSGTAAAQAAVLGALAGRARQGDTLVHSAIEHSAVLHAAGRGKAAEVGVDRLGRLDLDAWESAVTAPGVGLAALISASHEVGTLQPVAAAAGYCAEAGVPLFVDAAQSVGRVPVPAGWSLLSASAHKWGGPPGVGVLVTRKGVRWISPYPQDDLYRPGLPGALDLPAVVAAAASLRAVLADAETEARRLSALVDRIRERVAATVPDVEVVGDPVDRLPNLVTFSCLYVDGEALLHALDRAGFAVSS